MKFRVITGIILTLLMLVVAPLVGVSFEVVDFMAQSDVHDVAIIDVALSKTVICQGYSMPIYVTVENQGNFTETFGVATPYEGVVIPTSVQWETFWSIGDVNRNGYIDMIDIDLINEAMFSQPGDWNWNPDADLNQDLVVDHHDAIICGLHVGEDIWMHFGLPLPPIGSQRGVKLYSGTGTTLTLKWNTTGFAKGNYTISANATVVPGETDTGDNSFTDGSVRVNMPGDVAPAYGIVDIVDVVYVAIHFGATREGNIIIVDFEAINGEPEYEPNADINSDGIIDIVDIVIVAIHFGETDP